MLHVSYRKNLHINGKDIFVLLQEEVFLQSTNFPLPLIKMLCAVYYDLSPLTLIMFAKGFDCPMNFTHKEQWFFGKTAILMLKF